MSARCLGVTGHRRLDGAHPGLLKQRLAEVLTAASVRMTPPWIASSLAEGADRLAAEAALDMGFELFCPLPFEAAEYEKDFQGAASVEEFRRLLSRAREVSTVAVPPGSARDLAYTLAGRAVIARSRVLLALWDGLPPRG